MSKAIRRQHRRNVINRRNEILGFPRTITYGELLICIILALLLSVIVIYRIDLDTQFISRFYTTP